MNDKVKNNKVIIISLAVVVVVIAIFAISKLFGGKLDSVALKYLPKKASDYNVVCTRSSNYGDTGAMTQYDVVGIEEMGQYLSYSFAIVISKDDGSEIADNENNRSVSEEIESNLNSSGFVGISSSFKDGKVVVNYGMSNYEFSKAKDAKSTFESNGYTCK